MSLVTPLLDFCKIKKDERDENDEKDIFGVL
jgi:hypothetical protein